jgi:hypothetical protein
LSTPDWQLLQESDPDFSSDLVFDSKKALYLHNGKFFVPAALRPKVLHDIHMGVHGVHFGPVKTAALIRTVASWPSMDADVKRFIVSCPHCQFGKSARPARQGYQEIVTPTDPWHSLALDFMGPFPKSSHGNSFALLVLDLCTRQIYTFPLPDTTSDTTIRSLAKLFKQNGVPFALISDNAKSFVSKKFQAFCDFFGVSHKHTTPLRPTANGIAERAIRTLKGLLRAWAHQQGIASPDWDKKLALFTTAYNAVPHASFVSSPNHLAQLPNPVPKALQWIPHDPPAVPPVPPPSTFAPSKTRRAAMRLRNQPSQHPASPIPIGRLVMRFRKHPTRPHPWRALRPPWDGPFTIVGFQAPTTYSLKSPKSGRIFKIHRDLIREFRA